MTDLLATLLFITVLSYILAPYWWRSGWWRIPHGDMVGPLRERVAAIERQIGDLEFEAESGKITMADLESSRARRALERDRLLRQLDRLGGMVALRPLPPAIQHDRRCEECGAPCVTGSRFCAECGTPLKPRPLPPLGGESAKLARRKIVRLHGVVIGMAGVLALGPGDPTLLSAMEPVHSSGVGSPGPNAMQPPHETMTTGTITGLLRMGGETLRNHAYDIVVRMGEQEVVRVKRTTDDTGHFVIKNIFPHEALRYFLEVTHQGAHLSSPPLQLAPEREQASLDVALTPNGAANAIIIAGSEKLGTEKLGTGTFFSSGEKKVPVPNFSQRISLGLCGVVIVAMMAKIVWYRRRRRADVV